MSNQILRLPDELKLIIFEAQESLMDALRLSSTCRSLKSLATAKMGLICRSMLKKMTPCPEDVQFVAKQMAAVDPKNNQNVWNPELELWHQISLVKQSDLVASINSRYYEDWSVERAKCPYGLCYKRRSTYCPLEEHRRLVHAFLFIKLCVVSHQSPELRLRCERTARALPRLDLEFFNITFDILLNHRPNRLETSDFIDLGILEPDEERMSYTLLYADVNEICLEDWHEAWEFLDEVQTYDERGEVHPSETIDKWFACLKPRRPKGCVCPHEAFLSPDLATGSWLPTLRRM